MELVVKDIQGKETGRKVNLNESIFGIEPNDHAIYLDVKQYLAHQRQGTHKAKERAEIARTTKKHHRQKGTGGARYGSLKSPLHRGGGTVFGPRPRFYGFKLNKKLKRLARVSALSLKAKDQAITVLENFDMESPKTKEFIGILSALGVSDKKTLMVLGESNKNVYLSSRNFQGVKVVNASELNTYELLKASSLILTEGAIEKIENALS
ncbi:MAG: 50S ribosomal protein L4 [Bacteroidota bacterium]|nr:50S ribosomal protein L4 [Bacteroidota bacterium]MDX5448789.1 50S ribosomal protein L4 [Bacteroidota bacterium]MDX5505699.1 50S ribosomal protein L4 [Bacteroidota bacterium]